MSKIITIKEDRHNKVSGYRYDIWLETPAVDALTVAERETDPETCQRCHGIPGDDCDRDRCDDPRVP